MTIDIRPIHTEDYAAAHAFQCEYLDRESNEAFNQRVEDNPDLYLGAFARTGIGSRLIAAFEGAVQARGLRRIDLAVFSGVTEPNNNIRRS